METSNVKATHNQSVGRQLSETAQELLDKLKDIDESSKLQSDEIIVDDFANRMGLSKNVASKRLEILVELGVLTSRNVRHEGYRKKAYREATGENE